MIVEYCPGRLIQPGLRMFQTNISHRLLQIPIGAQRFRNFVVITCPPIVRATLPTAVGPTVTLPLIITVLSCAGKVALLVLSPVVRTLRHNFSPNETF